MDISSKVKALKEEVISLDEQEMVLKRRIAELQALKEQKKQKESKIEDLKKLEADLLASL